MTLWIPPSRRWATALCFCGALTIQSAVGQTSGALGQFEDQGDVGTVLHPGTLSFDASQGSYSIAGSGENMWTTADAFHFVWKKFSGDVSITADIAFPTTTGNPHKKAVLMIRQSLDADSAYVDATLHLDGLTSLQSRAEKGAATHEVGIAAASPTRLRLEKRGSEFFLYLARAGEDLHLGGGSMRLALKEPFYIGLGVCAHDKDAVETAVFSNVSIAPPSQGKPKLHSTLETISISSTDRRVVAVFDKRIEAPSWNPDGTALVFKDGKQFEQIPAVGGKVETVEHTRGRKKAAAEGASPDGLRVASLSHDAASKDVTLRVKTLSDGKEQVLAKLVGGKGTLGAWPWSPDSKRLVFVSYQLVP